MIVSGSVARRAGRRRAVVAASIALATVVVTAAPTAARAAAGADVLGSGARLVAGQQLVSQRTTLTMQSDGNVVVVRDERVLWSTATAGHPGAALTMQTDGNLVVRAANGAAVWSTGTTGEPGGTAILLDQGLVALNSPTDGAYWDNRVGGAAYGLSVVMPGQALRSDDPYRNAANAPYGSEHGIGLYVEPGGGAAVFETVAGVSIATLVLGPQSGAGAPGVLTMQTDGNLVLRPAGGAATWASRTSGANLRLLVQSDGNLVIRDPSRRAVWSAGITHALLGAGERAGAGTVFVAKNLVSPPGAKLVFQTDGNLVRSTADGRVLWASRTAGNSGATLAMQTDGNLVIRAANGRAVWSTGTAGCGTGVVLDTRTVTVQTSHGDVWSAAGGRLRC